jgi:hypothetical protein
LWNVVSWPIAIGIFFVSRLNGSGPDYAALFIPGIFCLIGLVLIGVLVRRFIIAAGFSPAELTIGKWPLRMGEAITVTFRRRSRGITVERVEAWLRCTEVAEYRVGTDTRTVREVVWEQALPQPPLLPDVSSVEASWPVAIPLAGPPSFSAYRNTVVWSLDVTLRNRNFPDATSSFVLLVRPEVVQ